MKKYFIGLIAIISVITCSFALTPSHLPVSKKQVSLYWFIPGLPGTYTGRQNTKANEISITGCPDTGSRHCEDGYDDNDLVTSGAPYNGLKSGATVNEVIMMP